MTIQNMNSKMIYPKIRETLDANLDTREGYHTGKSYLVQITVEIPYPKTLEFRQEASGIAPAVSRAIKSVRRQLKGKRIREMKIKAVQL